MQIDLTKVAAEVNAGYISMRSHPTADLRIYNYTAKTQYDQHWTPETMACRGLIVDGQDNIVARPFPKFFNADQHSKSDLIWSKPFTVTAKLDGSLGILYQAPDGPAIATRGSFTSEQAVVGTAILRGCYPLMRVPVGLTVLFEIIYPENRIVCDYGDERDLHLLAVLETATGKEIGSDPSQAALEAGWCGPVVEHFALDCKPSAVMATLGKQPDELFEGVVLRFEYPKGSHTRMKVKTEEYKRLHRILTGISERSIWEELRATGDISDLIERVPDEFYNWARGVETRLNVEYDKIWLHASEYFDRLDFSGSRRDIAERIKAYPEPGILFAMLDRKDYSDHIWKMIRPETKVFRYDEGAM